MPERHLGLLPAAEVADIDALIDTLADQLTLDDAAWESLPSVSFSAVAQAEVLPLLQGRTIAVARDAAFAFLYPANLACLRALGAELLFFTPVADELVPAGADAIYLPGGYPELHAAALANARRWKQSMHQAYADGVPIWAECGGMMAVCDNLIDLAGESWEMAGLLPGTVSMQKRLAGLGSQGVETAVGTWRGHTFHYSSLDSAHAACTHARKHPSGAQGEAFHALGSLTASYFHAYFPSCIEATAAIFSGRALLGEGR